MGMYIYNFFVNFSVWLFIEEAFFAAVLPKQKHFVLRMSLMLAVYFTMGYGCIELVKQIPPQYGFAASNLYYIGLFMVSLLIMKACVESDWKEVLFAGTAGYAVQHMTYSLLLLLKGLSLCFNIPMGWLDVISQLHDIPAYLLTGLISYYALIKPNKHTRELRDSNLQINLISLAILFTSVSLSEIVFRWGGGAELPYRMVCRAYAVITCLLGLLLQFDISKRNRVETNQELLERLLALEQQKQTLSKEAIEMINLKCHDIKYQVAALETMDDPAQRRDAVQQLQQSAVIYDNVMKTGNDTLDLVLTEKSLLCQKYNIKFSCIADGRWLDFMAPTDIYTLFGNAMDNAIEAVSAAEEEKRVITLHLSRKAQMLLIHMDNYCGTEQTFVDGLPVTTKADAKVHGFGTKSIQYVVNRYGGDMTMAWQDERFELDILFRNEDAPND